MLASLLVLFLLTCFAVPVFGEDNSVVFVREVNSEDDLYLEPGSVVDSKRGLSEELFIPSKAWQKVKPGQTLPSGLHYRINMQTGEKEAKLLDEVDNNLKTVNDGWVDTSGKFNQLSDEELKVKLANIPDDGPSQHTPPDLTQFKDIEELKKDFEKLNQQIQTESEIVQDIVAYLRNQTSDLDRVEDLLAKLEDLAYFTHQIDTAHDFLVQMKGLELIKALFNHSDSSVKQATLKVLTSCLQSNQKLKVYSMERGQLLQFLTQVLNSKVNKQVSKSAFNSLSALLRNFPYAQQLFGDMNGFDFLCLLANEGDLPALKVLQLTTDLVIEARFAKEDHFAPDKTVAAQYQLASVQDRMECVCGLITTKMSEPGLPSNLNEFEIIIETTHQVVESHICDAYRVRKWLEALKPIFRDWYVEKDLRRETVEMDAETIEYWKEVRSKLDRLLHTMRDSLDSHSEL